MKKDKDSKKDKRVKHKLKYLGKEERMVHLARSSFIVNKNDVFDVSVRDLERFKDKELFGLVK